jgi:hypothetical protein
MLGPMQRRGLCRWTTAFASFRIPGKCNPGNGKAAVIWELKPDSAMPQEQKSLPATDAGGKLVSEIQVSFANQSGGSGSGSQANAEDLADLFELELNKLKNQYETVQRGEQQARDQKLDEALQKLKELAQRQQQLNERNRMLAQQGRPQSSSGGGGGAQSQQQLLEQAEQLKRQLQRLSRERSSPQLNEASSRIEKAIEEMKKALNGSQQGNGAEASAQGVRALQQLDDAARKLARQQQAGLSQGLDQAVAESRKLVDEQKRIQEGIDRLSKDKQQSGLSIANQLRDDMVARKTTLADRVKIWEIRSRSVSDRRGKTQEAVTSSRKPERTSREQTTPAYPGAETP